MRYECPRVPAWALRRRYLFGLGSISSVWTSYLVQGKLGYQATPIVSIGPETMALGNDRFDEVRVGGFVGFNITPAAQLIASGGYARDSHANSLNNHSGGYGTVHLRTSF
jgi:cellulose biosynthesis protein BcsS